MSGSSMVSNRFLQFPTYKLSYNEESCLWWGPGTQGRFPITRPVPTITMTDCLVLILSRFKLESISTNRFSCVDPWFQERTWTRTVNRLLIRKTSRQVQESHDKNFKWKFVYSVSVCIFRGAVRRKSTLWKRSSLVVISLILTPWVIPNPSTLHSQGVKRTNTELVFSKRVESEKKIKISGWTNDFFRVKEWWLKEREKFKTRRLLQDQKNLLKRKSEDFWRHPGVSLKPEEGAKVF